MQRVPQNLLRNKHIEVAVNDEELEQLATLAKWYFKDDGELGVNETEMKPRKRKGVCLLARLMVNELIQRMMAEMQAEMQANATGTESA